MSTKRISDIAPKNGPIEVGVLDVDGYTRIEVDDDGTTVVPITLTFRDDMGVSARFCMSAADLRRIAKLCNRLAATLEREGRTD